MSELDYSNMTLDELNMKLDIIKDIIKKKEDELIVKVSSTGDNIIHLYNICHGSRLRGSEYYFIYTSDNEITPIRYHEFLGRWCDSVKFKKRDIDNEVEISRADIGISINDTFMYSRSVSLDEIKT